MEQYGVLEQTVLDLDMIEENIQTVTQRMDLLSENDRRLLESYDTVNRSILLADRIASDNALQAQTIWNSVAEENEILSGINTLVKDTEDELARNCRDTVDMMGTRNVIIAVNNFPPYTEYDGVKDCFQGFDIDLIQEIFRRNHREVIFRYQSFDTCIRHVAVGLADLTPTLAYKPERARIMDFSKPYIFQGNQFIFITNPHFSHVVNQLEDLTDQIVGIVRSCNYPETFLNDCRILKDISQSTEGLFSKLKKGQIHAALLVKESLNDATLKDTIRKQFRIQPLVLADDSDETYMGFNKAGSTESLLKAFNDGLTDVIADGTYALLCRKYDIPCRNPDSLPTPSLNFASIAGA